MNKTLLRIASCSLLLGASALAVASHRLFNFAVRRDDRKYDFSGSKEDTMFFTVPLESSLNLLADAADLHIINRDGLRLHAKYIRKDPKRFVILCHGYTSKGEHMASFAEHFLRMGYSVLMPDLRAHGESEGDYFGMGWLDRLDLPLWVSRLLEENPKAEIALFGISMGASAVLMTAGEALPENVRLVISDCGFTSVDEQFSHSLRTIYHLPSFPLMQAASQISKRYAGYSFFEASAVEQLKKSYLPVLLIHGTKDSLVPFSMLATLARASKGPTKTLAIEGAKHAQSSFVDPALYWGTIRSFLKSHGM